MEVASASATTNAGCVTRNLIDTYLITHPHLDHISGFVINTAGLPGTRPKRLAGLPSTISAFKQHIFNNVIWPNLSDENNGAGLVTYMRLVEGGSPALGQGDGKGYLEISDGLAVKLFSVSHGHCIERHSHRGSTASSRFSSFDATSLAPSPRGVPGSTAAPGLPSIFRTSAGAATPTPATLGGPEKEAFCVYDSSAYFIRDSATGREVLMFGDVEPDTISLSPRNAVIWQEAAPRIAAGHLTALFIECSYDDTQTDDCLFGHLTPRYLIRELQALANAVSLVRQWEARVQAIARDLMKKKRKRDDEELEATTNGTTGGEAGMASGGEDHPVSPRSTRPAKKGPSSAAGADHYNNSHNHTHTHAHSYNHNNRSGTNTPHIATPTAEMSLRDLEVDTPPPNAPAPAPPPNPQTSQPQRPVNALRGLKVVVIHVKERLVDGEAPRDTILAQLLEAEKEAQLGCEFVVSRPGQSFLL